MSFQFTREKTDIVAAVPHACEIRAAYIEQQRKRAVDIAGGLARQMLNERVLKKTFRGIIGDDVKQVLRDRGYTVGETVEHAPPCDGCLFSDCDQEHSYHETLVEVTPPDDGVEVLVSTNEIT
jgi:hypothetical protein